MQRWRPKVAPNCPSPAPPKSAETQLPSRWRRGTICILHTYNGAIWTLLSMLLFAQFFGVIWSSVTSDGYVNFGHPPSQGKFAIPGLNDEPYSDRGVACVKMGDYFRPVQLSTLLQQTANETSLVNSSKPTTNGVDGYRVVTRDSYAMNAASYSYYVRQCSTLSLTLDNIFTACTALGYNVTRDVLRIVDGVDSDKVIVLPATLPVLIMPYWDYGSLSRYIVPGQDGSACVFRGGGTFNTEIEPSVALLYAVSRAVRETQTESWLEYPGGVWRNGWYEDPVVHMRWYSDVTSSVPQGKYGISLRQFDLFNHTKEADCTKPPLGCRSRASMWSWDQDIRMTTCPWWYHSIAVSNGSRFGLFLYETTVAQTITSRYSVEKLLSNASLATLLVRWIVLLVALLPTDTIGIGVLANSQSFHLLAIFLLPRFKSSLQGFWTAGCAFEGNQRALADAWFEIYPAIGEVVFLYFSVLNIVAKLLRRRVSDALFGPTLLAFGLLHYFRVDLATRSWLVAAGRVSTIVTAEELEAASVLDFFTTDLAFRVNGNVRSIFYLKLVVLGLNAVLPLLVFSHRVAAVHSPTLAIETALAIHFDSNAGLGSTHSPYDDVDGNTVLRPYELARAGFLVVGDSSPHRVLVSVDHWMWLIATAPLRCMMVMTVRVAVYSISTHNNERELHNGPAAATSVTGAKGLDEPQIPSSSTVVENVEELALVGVADESLLSMRVWRIAACAFR